MLRAIRSVVPFDTYEGPSISFVEPEPGEGLDVGSQLREAAACPEDRLESLDRFAYDELARGAFCVVRTGEQRKYGNALLRKGVVGVDE